MEKLAVHVHINGGGDRPGEVGVGVLAGQPLSEEATNNNLPKPLNLEQIQKQRNELTVHVHIDGGGDRPGEVGVGSLAGQPLSEEAPVDIVKRDLVPYCSVTQDMVRLVN